MPTYTTTYSLGKPVVGADEDAWGDTLNTSLDAIDDILDGTTPVTGIDINSGTLDGVTIGGTTAGAGTFTTLTANTSITGTLATAAQPNVTSLGTLTSLAVSGDVSFGDNDKAIFGAGSDLQIYHDGLHSYVKDNGTGDLYLQGTANVRITNTSGQKMFLGQDGGEAQLYYSGVEKLATTSTGIDVTGTVTADGLTVDGDITLQKNNPVITIADTGTTNQQSFIRQLSGTLYFDGQAGATTDGSFLFRGYDGSTSKMLISYNGDISFYEDTGTTPKFHWSASAESLGIGTSSISDILHVVTPSFGGITLECTGATADPTFKFLGDSGNYWSLQQDASQADSFQFRYNNSEKVRIDSSGNLLVGKPSPAGVSTNGVELRNDGIVIASKASGISGYFGRTSTDGEIIRFYRDSTTVGSIASAGVNIAIGSDDVGLLFGGSFATPAIGPRNMTTAADNDGGINLGWSTNRFKDLYLSGGVYLGGTGSANKLDDYETGTWTPVFADAISGGNTVNGDYGYYTKVGEMVTLYFKGGNLNTSTMTGANTIYVQGLPFQSAATTGFGFYTGSTHTSLVTSEGNPTVLVPDATSYAYFGDGNSGYITVSDVTSGSGDFYVTITYRAA
jgi:hypothetical protein